MWILNSYLAQYQGNGTEEMVRQTEYFHFSTFFSEYTLNNKSCILLKVVVTPVSTIC